MSGATARIDTRAIRHNLGVIRRRTPRSKVMAVIKANAYGHGLVAVADALQEADALAVARLEEALQLRAAGIEIPIVLLGGIETAAQLSAAVTHSLQIVVHAREQLELLDQWQGGGVDVWLKFDSGMHRLGFSSGSFLDAWKRLDGMSCVAKPIRLMSHFAQADESDGVASRIQLDEFLEATADIPGEKSLANSAGILSVPDSHLDWVRPGIMLYGVSPLARQTGADLMLQPAMQLFSRLVAVKSVAAGRSVGYGARWTARKDTVIGIAAIGYGDGYPWSLPDATPVLVNGRRCRLAGRVSMDMIAIELDDEVKASYGDPVVLWGEELPVELIAERAGTVPYELLCGITQRVHSELV